MVERIPRVKAIILFWEIRFHSHLLVLFVLIFVLSWFLNIESFSGLGLARGGIQPRLGLLASAQWAEG
jgi:hypothetical protein